MSYSKYFNIQKKKNEESVGVNCVVTVDHVELINNGKEGRLSKGDFLDAKTKQEKLDDLQKGLDEGRLTEESFQRRLEGIQKIPDFVHAQVSKKIDGVYFHIGEIVKRKDGKGMYFKFGPDQTILVDQGKKVLFEKSQFGNIQSKQDELNRIKYLLDNNRMKEETYTKVKGDIENQPDFILLRCDAKGKEL